MMRTFVRQGAEALAVREHEGERGVSVRSVGQSSHFVDDGATSDGLPLGLDHLVRGEGGDHGRVGRGPACASRRGPGDHCGIGDGRLVTDAASANGALRPAADVGLVGVDGGAQPPPRLLPRGGWLRGRGQSGEDLVDVLRCELCVVNRVAVEEGVRGPPDGGTNQACKVGRRLGEGVGDGGDHSLIGEAQAGDRA